MSNRKVTDLVAVDHYCSYIDDEYLYGGTARVTALENRKVTDLVVVENYSNNDDDESSNSYGGTAHEVPVPESHPLDHEDPSHVPNCVLKLRKRSKNSPAFIKALLHRRLRKSKIFMISVDVEDNTVAICGDVNPASLDRTVSECAGERATLVFFKEHPHRSQAEHRPLYCENIVFRIYGDYCNLVREELQKMKGINSVIVDSSHDVKLWMSISGDCFNAGVIRKRVMKLCDCDSKKDIKILSKKVAKHTPDEDFKAPNDATNTIEGRGTLVSIDDPIVSNSMTKNHQAGDVEITVDFVVPRNQGHECATQINEMLLSTKGVNLVITHIHRSRLTSVNVRGDDRLDLDTFLKTVLDAGGIKPRLRRSLISQLISAFCG